MKVRDIVCIIALILIIILSIFHWGLFGMFLFAIVYAYYSDAICKGGSDSKD